MAQAAFTRRPFRALLLSTYEENIGDDLIRDGTVELVRRVLGPGTYRHVGKSNPLGLVLPPSYLAHGPTHRMPGLLRRAVRLLGRVSRLAGPPRADLAVVAGTPLFYHLTFGTFLELEPWIDHFYRRVLVGTVVPLLTLGIGSILPGEPPRLAAGFERERQFIADFIDRSAVVTARDDATMDLLRECQRADSRTPVLRTLCPSFWAADGFGIRRDPAATDGRTVSVSFSLESTKWDANAADTVRRRWVAVETVLGMLRAGGFQPRLVCHNEFDVPPARSLASRHRLPPPLRATSRTMLEQFARSRAVVTWRVHGALGAHSLGVPALLFRTDSRDGLARELGLPILDDRVQSGAELAAAVERLFALPNTGRSPELAARMAADEAALRKVIGV